MSSIHTDSLADEFGLDILFSMHTNQPNRGDSNTKSEILIQSSNPNLHAESSVS